MGSKEQQKALLNQQLEQLGSITNSPSVNKTSIIAHASKYIEELKERIDKLNEDVSTSQPSHHDHEDALPEAASTKFFEVIPSPCVVFRSPAME
ncbi:hypothetical protein KY285_035604 [Solanum tuberosum]|nr:hypothetical protein KY285_035604 [Solanum tuberosum]